MCKRDRLADNATERINAYFTKHPEVEIIYGDEDLMNEKGERLSLIHICICKIRELSMN